MTLDFRSQRKISNFNWFMQKHIKSFLVIAWNQVPMHMSHLVHVNKIYLSDFKRFKHRITNRINCVHKIIVITFRQSMKIWHIFLPNNHNMTTSDWMRCETNIQNLVFVNYCFRR